MTGQRDFNADMFGFRVGPYLQIPLDKTNRFNVSFSGVSSGATNESQTLSVSAVSSNTALITIQSVTYTSPSTSGSVRLRTSSSGKGTAVVAVTVNDGIASNNVVTRAFTVFLKPSTNAYPTISTLTNRARTGFAWAG